MTRERFPLPSQERLKELFDYDPETGILTAKVARGNRGGYEVGAVVGYKDQVGYLKASIDHRPLMLHRVIWKWMTGSEPPSHLDHINRVKSDNRWANLREADASRNSANRTPAIANFSGAKGVTLDYRGRWRASITVKGEARYLGDYVTREEAIEAYNKAAVEAYGEFACTETGPSRILVDVITLVDEQLLDAMAGAARRMLAYRLDGSVPEHVKDKLTDIALDLTTELARIHPEKYGQMRKRAA